MGMVIGKIRKYPIQRRVSGTSRVESQIFGSDSSNFHLKLDDTNGPNLNNLSFVPGFVSMDQRHLVWRQAAGLESCEYFDGLESVETWSLGHR